MRVETPRRDYAAGQAQIELVAAVPFLILGVLVLLQLFGVLYAQSLADGAAEAGALAAADGRDPKRAVRSALPGWARVEVDVDGGRVGVDARPPVVLPLVGQRLEVSAEAYARGAR